MNSNPVLPATYILLPNLPPVYFSVSRVFTCGLDRCHLYHGQCFGSHGHRCYPCVSCTIGQERDHDSYHYVIMIRIILDVVSDYCIAFTVMHAVAGAAVFGNGTRSLHACSGVSCCVRCWCMQWRELLCGMSGTVACMLCGRSPDLLNIAVEAFLLRYSGFGGEWTGEECGGR